MKPTTFKGQNIVFGENQPEYLPLPALRMTDGEVITCWELSEQEIEDIVKNKKMFLSQLTYGHPLQAVKLFVNLEDGLELT